MILIITSWSDEQWARNWAMKSSNAASSKPSTVCENTTSIQKSFLLKVADVLIWKKRHPVYLSEPTDWPVWKPTWTEMQHMRCFKEFAANRWCSTICVIRPRKWMVHAIAMRQYFLHWLLVQFLFLFHSVLWFGMRGCNRWMNRRNIVLFFHRITLVGIHNSSSLFSPSR